MAAVGGRCDRAFGGFPPPAARENGRLKVTPSRARLKALFVKQSLPPQASESEGVFKPDSISNINLKSSLDDFSYETGVETPVGLN